MNYDDYDNYAGKITEWPKTKPLAVWDEPKPEQPSRIMRLLWLAIIVVSLVICGVTR